MKTLLALTFLCIVVPYSLGLTISKIAPAQSKRSPKVDWCDTCVELMNEAIDELLNAILNGGVIGGCEELCAFVPDPLAQAACNLICDYVGIDVFIDAVNDTDPDPIYVCQLMELCAEVNGGNATINSVIVEPKSGPAGTQFNISMYYTITSPTGPGLLSCVIIPPDAFPFGGDDFVDGQAVGSYGIAFGLDSTPSEQEPFSPGSYQVQLAVCEGDCGNIHPYSGVYAQAFTSFQITG